MATGTIQTKADYYKAGDVASWSVYVGGGSTPSGLICPAFLPTKRLVEFTLELPKKIPEGLNATVTSLRGSFTSTAGSIDSTDWETQLVGRSGRTVSVVYSVDNKLAISYTSTSDMGGTTGVVRPATFEMTEYSVTFS